MANYIPPDNDSVFFNFSASGYSKPNFDAVTFNFSSKQVSDLQAAIGITQLYYDTTFTYVKECRKVVVGYSSAGIQVIDLPCLFGGIRDLSFYVVCKSKFISSQKDLHTFSRTVFPSTSTLISYARARKVDSLDLTTYSHAWYKSTLDMVVATRVQRSGVAYFSSFTRKALAGSADIFGYTKFVRGHNVTSDLSADLVDIQPVNIAAALNIIELRNLVSNIEGIYFKGETSFSTEFARLFYRDSKNISSAIHGWAALDLSGRIRAFYTKDLNADLFAGFFAVVKNLSSIIYAIAPKNLAATLQGYDTLSLNAFTIMGYTPNDLQVFINIIKHENLLATIYGKFGVAVHCNLPAYLKSTNERNLLAYVDVNEARNLTAYIDAVGKYLDLSAKIAPRTINIKRMLFVPLFEHLDLKATIQYSCKSSGFNDFTAYLYPIRKLDLKAYIIGWYGGTADNIKDLAAYINYNTYITQSYINIEGFSRQQIQNTVDVNIQITNDYEVFDTYSVLCGNAHKSLLANIVGHFQSLDLQANVIAKPIANFTTTPSWVNPSTLEAVINLERFEERWTRFVEMLFFTNASEDFHYFYVSGENKIYKVDKKRTWKIYVTGYNTPEEDIFTRVKVNKKIIFNLSTYASVDDAIRDLIDRVSLYRSSDLAASINAYDFEYSNLYANLHVKQLSSWVSSIKANIKGTNQAYVSYAATIQPNLYKDTNNLTVLIVAKSYEAPAADDVLFKFKEPGYSPPSYYYNMNWTYKEAEVFWKED